MKITVIGTGYVGLPTGACLAEFGNHVICVDSDRKKVERLRRGECPIFEPGLQPLLERNIAAKRLSFTDTLTGSASDSEVFFIAVGTPSKATGEADLQYLESAVISFAQIIDKDAVLVIRSTVPVGTTQRMKALVDSCLLKRKLDHLNVPCVFVPEFLKQGAAVNDTMRPDRIIIGSDSPYAINSLKSVFSPMMRNHERILVMSDRSAEMTKYAANAMLATKISFMNEISQFCDGMGADVEDVRKGIGADPRIGYSFIYPGVGYGGSCFPKDVRALLAMAADQRIEARILTAVDSQNEKQKRYLAKKILRYFNDDISGRVFGIWGLAFKPETDDMREAPSLALIDALLQKGACCHVYDPVATANVEAFMPQDWLKEHKVRLCSCPYAAAEGTDGLCLLTEWKEFRSPDFQRLKEILKHPVIFDGRNIYDPAAVEQYGIEYFGIGRGMRV